MPLRSTLVGAASGVVLLAGVFGFAVGLPEVVGDDAEAAPGADAGSDRPVEDLLPLTLLDGALQRYSDIDPQYSEMSLEVEAYSGDKLAEVFGADAAVALYATPDVQTQVAVTIYDGESGLFLQTGPPVPPAMSANAETVSDYVREGDSVCFVQWQAGAQEAGQPPFQLQCQRVVAGHTVNVYTGGGVSIEQAVDMVDDVVAQADLG